MLVAGVDVGGTNIEVGLVDDEHQVIARAKRNTPREGPDAVITTIASLIESLNEEPVAVGAGIPGVIHDGQALTVPNLENWVHQVDVAAELQRALGVPIALGDDVNGGWGRTHRRRRARRVDGHRHRWWPDPRWGTVPDALGGERFSA